MGRSGYTEDWDNNWQTIMWRGAVNSAIKGKRGQGFLKELAAALDAMPNKRLIPNELECEGEVCALGAVGKARGLEMTKLDPDDEIAVAETFNIAKALATEIVYINDDDFRCLSETPEQRYIRVREWVQSQIKE